MISRKVVVEGFLLGGNVMPFCTYSCIFFAVKNLWNETDQKQSLICIRV